jgi:hypothetical protein
MAGKDKILNLNLLQLFVLIILGTLLGCKSLQKINRGIDMSKEIALMIEKIQMAEPQFSTIDIRKMNVKVNINNQQQYNSQAYCKMISDSVIYISIQPFFGIEMFSVRFTPEGFIFIDKTKSVYYQSDYSFLDTRFNLDLDYATIQSLLMNKLFIIGENEVQPAMLKNIRDKNAATGVKYENERYTQTVMLKPDYRISDIAINFKTGAQQFKTVYTDFGTTGQLTSFPYGLNFSIVDGAKKFILEMSISRLSVNETVILPELNLNKYRQGNISTLLK